jgi:hypothetical protein
MPYSPEVNDKIRDSVADFFNSELPAGRRRYQRENVFLEEVDLRFATTFAVGNVGAGNVATFSILDQPSPVTLNGSELTRPADPALTGANSAPKDQVVVVMDMRSVLLRKANNALQTLLTAAEVVDTLNDLAQAQILIQSAQIRSAQVDIGRSLSLAAGVSGASTATDLTFSPIIVEPYAFKNPIVLGQQRQIGAFLKHQRVQPWLQPFNLQLTLGCQIAKVRS